MNEKPEVDQKASAVWERMRREGESRPRTHGNIVLEAHAVEERERHGGRSRVGRDDASCWDELGRKRSVSEGERGGECHGWWMG